jgi:hypothetical protein
MKRLLIKDNPADQEYLKELPRRFNGISSGLIARHDRDRTGSGKVRSFLIRHYRHGEDTAPEICRQGSVMHTVRKAGKHAG